ncbi:MAG: anti-sigma factor RsiW [Bradymonadia bacterium]|jgi:anti-sigma factor RsiW
MTDTTESAVGRYFDGEMPPEELRAFEAQLAEDPALREELSALRITQEIVQTHFEAKAEQASFEGFFDRISMALPAERAIEAAPTPAQPAAPEALGSRLKAWWGRNWTPVLIGAAAAAAVTFFALRDDTSTIDDADSPMMAGAGEVTVDEVNNDGPTTVLISMPADDGDSTVIWLLDDEDDDEGAIDAPSAEEDPI